MALHPYTRRRFALENTSARDNRSIRLINKVKQENETIGKKIVSFFSNLYKYIFSVQR